MHDRTRRLVCRVAFLALCVVPAALVLVWSSWCRGRSQQRACAAELSRAIGLDVSFASVSYPRPGIVLYQAVELSDPETAAPLARMRALETGGSGVVASQPELDAVQLRDFWRLVDRRLRETTATPTMTLLSAAETTLHWPTGSQTFTGVSGQISLPGTAGEPRTATISFRIAGIDMQEPVLLRVTRERDGAPGDALSPNSRLKTTLELNTAGAALPCAMLAVPLGIENRLGTRATFRGSIWATQTVDGWEGELAGQFSDVDLQSLVSQQFPHRLSGTAEITVRKARFRGGRLEEADGTLSAGSGVVSQSLVSAAIEFLHLVPGPANSRAADTLLQYDQLSLTFAVDSTGLTLRGRCEGAPGVVMRLGDGTVLAEPSGPPGPLVALVRTLVPRSEVQVPATRESDWLIERLPMPQAILPEGQTPQGRLLLDRKNPWGSDGD